MAPTGGRTANRWLVAVMGTLLQLCLGTVYAWSYFQKPLTEQYGWTNTQVAWIFSLAICFLGLAAAWGGVALPKFGPRRLAMSGGALFGIGYLLSALALHIGSLPLLYVSYGVIGGTGLGLGYVTPVATAATWFPDKKGLVTGMVIMGFGFGALLMSKVFAPVLLQLSHGSLVFVFGGLGLFFVVVTMLVASFLRNPPAGFVPPGWPPPHPPPAASTPGPAHSAGPMLHSRRFLTMWLLFFANILAGISLIGFQSPLLQDLWRAWDAALTKEALAGLGATLIAVSSLFNGIGRLFWGGLSDRIGRVQTFRLILASQVVVFLVLARVENPWLFCALVCYVLLCYGGGFGTMPSFVLDVFGTRAMAVVYGTILTAWSAAGIAGPQLVAWIKDHYADKAASYSFQVAAAVLAVGFVLSLTCASPEFRKAGTSSS